jgi:hypothetical protein
MTEWNLKFGNNEKAFLQSERKGSSKGEYTYQKARPFVFFGSTWQVNRKKSCD